MEKENYEKAFKTQKYVNKMMDLYNICTPFIPAIKKAMVLKGLDIKEYCTSPFLPATKEETARFKTIMKELNIL